MLTISAGALGARPPNGGAPHAYTGTGVRRRGSSGVRSSGSRWLAATGVAPEPHLAPADQPQGVGRVALVHADAHAPVRVLVQQRLAGTARPERRRPRDHVDPAVAEPDVERRVRGRAERG